MNRILEPQLQNPLSVLPDSISSAGRTVPVITSASTVPIAASSTNTLDPLPKLSVSDTQSSISPSAMATITQKADNSGANKIVTDRTDDASHGHKQPVGAAAAAQQPKVVQTAFIHKLYSMLQDPNIQHLISWSSSNESFVMTPSPDFSKVLAQYFKHTNVSSFVRQLNMYGFHKVSDVFHTGSPDTTMWEFKHGNGNFKKGDVAGLREIRRRTSRHTLIHRDSFSGHKSAGVQPGTPAEPSDGSDAKFSSLEQSMFDLHMRLAQLEKNNSLLSSKCQALNEGLIRCHQWTNTMSSFVMSLVPDIQSPVHRDAANMQREVIRQLDTVCSLEAQAPFESDRPAYLGYADPGQTPLSPRQIPKDDGRRPSTIRPPMPPHMNLAVRRNGSFTPPSLAQGYNRSLVLQQPMQHHPLTAVSPSTSSNSSIPRRHTSADIREHWKSNTASLSPGNSSSQWPCSNLTQYSDLNAPDPHVRDVLARYEMGSSSRRLSEVSRYPSTPPPSIDSSGVSLLLPSENGWNINPSKYTRHLTNSSAPPSRRPSMASNVHSLLNPAETIERPETNESTLMEDRKRKRLQ